MIPVDRASPLTEISPRSYFFSKKNSMCSYERAGQPANQDLGFSDRDLGSPGRKLSHMNTVSRLPG